MGSFFMNGTVTAYDKKIKTIQLCTKHEHIKRSVIHAK